ncbi:MAG: NAD(+) synthase, partial [Negativicoccus succinicivorans]|nr:NAD(+) synthase [Negativicoccus succinicivorans]
PIKESVDTTRTQLETIAKAAGVSLSLDGLPYENLQARDRTSRVLATIASARGAIFTCNANKTETTVGYGTMYGDIAGALAATADLWKHEVYELAKDLDDFMGGGIIPREVFTVPPSAELSSAQDVTKGFGDPLIYPYHDYLFASWIQDTPLSLAEILECYEEHTLTKRLGATVEVETLFADADAFVADLERWWTLYRGLSIAKRVQAPPILAAGPHPFGKYSEVQGEPRYSDRYLAKRKKLLKK